MTEKNQRVHNWNLTKGAGLFNEPLSAEDGLGITKKEVEKWIKEDYRVLEIGPGLSGKLFFDLLIRGVDVLAIEPSFNFIDTLKSEYKKDFLFKILKNPLFAKQILKLSQLFTRIQPLYADEAYEHLLLKEKKADVAIAQGNNFQIFANSPEELMTSITGIMKGLTDEGYLTFELPKTQKLFLFGARLHFDLESALKSKNIRFEIRKTKRGHLYIKIYRKNNEGVLFEDSISSN